MCNPVSIASAAATVIGTGMQMQAQHRAQKGINNAINANGAANDKLRAASQQGIQDTAKTFSRENFDATQAAATQDLQKKYEDNLSQGTLPGEYYGGAQSDNTKQYAQTKATAANDYSDRIATALAQLRGFSQGQGVNTRNIQRTGEQVAMNQNKEQGNNAILPLQIEAAKQKGSSPLGDILTGLGSAGLSAGLASSAAGAAAGTAAKTAQGLPVGVVMKGVPAPGFVLA